MCNEDVVNKKPHPEGLEVAMEHLNKRPETCCYVGDSAVDVEMGKRAGMQTIGIIGGYPGSKELPNTNPGFLLRVDRAAHASLQILGLRARATITLHFVDDSHS